MSSIFGRRTFKNWKKRKNTKKRLWPHLITAPEVRSSPWADINLPPSPTGSSATGPPTPEKSKILWMLQISAKKCSLSVASAAGSLVEWILPWSTTVLSPTFDSVDFCCMALYVSLKVVLSPICFLTEVASKRSNTLMKFLGKKKSLVRLNYSKNELKTIYRVKSSREFSQVLAKSWMGRPLQRINAAMQRSSQAL